MTGADPSSKPWRALLAPEQRALFEAIEDDLSEAAGVVSLLDRDGARIGLADWIEARFDPSYVEVAETEIDGILISTTWIGVELDAPGWGRVLYGTQLIDVRPETLERLAEQPERGAATGPGQDRRPSFDLLDLLDPEDRELLFRLSHPSLAIAQAAHPTINALVACGWANPDKPPDAWPMTRILRLLPRPGGAADN